jgi:hypothetical protein
MEGVGEQRKKEGKEVGIWYKGKHNQPTPSILQLTGHPHHLKPGVTHPN